MRQAARNRLHEAEHLKTATNFERQVGGCGGEILCYKSAFQESHVETSVLADLSAAMLCFICSSNPL